MCFNPWTSRMEVDEIGGGGGGGGGSVEGAGVVVFSK